MSEREIDKAMKVSVVQSPKHIYGLAFQPIYAVYVGGVFLTYVDYNERKNIRAKLQRAINRVYNAALEEAKENNNKAGEK